MFKRPLLLIGQGVKGSRYREFAERYQIPVITSRLGIGLLEYDHPLFIGHPGNYGDVASKKAIENADLIICVGCRLASALVGYSPANWGKDAFKVVVDIDQKELDKPGVAISLKLNMIAKEFFNNEADYLMAKINFDEVTSATEERHKWLNVCQRWKKEFPIVTEEHRKIKPVSSYYFVDRLSALASANDIIMLDTGGIFHVACQAWKVKKGQRFITTGGLSSMGWWAACLGGGVLGHTIMMTGDGSLQMNIHELATVKHNNLPVKIFVMSNNGYGLIRQTQKRFFGRYIGEGPETGVWCPSLKKIAEAYEIPYWKIDNTNKLDKIIKAVLHGKVANSIYCGICEVMTPEWEELLRPEEVE